MLEFDLLRVFVDPEGGGGWPLAVFLTGECVDARDRPSVAAALGVPATVFVDDRERATVRTFTARGREVPLAGHALLGAAWLLDASGLAARALRTPVGRVPTWRADDLTWVRAAPDTSPGGSAPQGDGAGDPLRLAALCLHPALRRRLTIRTPSGLLLHARPATCGGIELGGRVAFVAATDYDTFTTART